MVFADEFNWINYDLDKWKLAVTGGVIVQDVKYANVERFSIEKEFIMASNLNPEVVLAHYDEYEKNALLKRLVVIKAEPFDGDKDFKKIKLRYEDEENSGDEDSSVEVAIQENIIMETPPGTSTDLQSNPSSPGIDIINFNSVDCQLINRLPLGSESFDFSNTDLELLANDYVQSIENNEEVAHIDTVPCSQSSPILDENENEEFSIIETIPGNQAAPINDEIDFICIDSDDEVKKVKATRPSKWSEEYTLKYKRLKKE